MFYDLSSNEAILTGILLVLAMGGIGYVVGVCLVASLKALDRRPGAFLVALAIVGGVFVFGDPIRLYGVYVRMAGIVAGVLNLIVR